MEGWDEQKNWVLKGFWKFCPKLYCTIPGDLETSVAKHIDYVQAYLIVHVTDATVKYGPFFSIFSNLVAVPLVWNIEAFKCTIELIKLRILLTLNSKQIVDNDDDDHVTLPELEHSRGEQMTARLH